MYIPNDNTQNDPPVDFNYWLKCFDTQVNEITYQKSIKANE